MHLHLYSKWRDADMINIYDEGYLPPNPPIRQERIQTKRCKVCNKLKTRRVKL